MNLGADPKKDQALFSSGYSVTAGDRLLDELVLRCPGAHHRPDLLPWPTPVAMERTSSGV